MDAIGTMLSKSLADCSREKSWSDALNAAKAIWEADSGLSPEERHKVQGERLNAKMAAYNASTGELDASEYNCPLCHNRGNIGHVIDTGEGFNEVYPECKCMAIRRSIWRMKASGLENSIRENTFKRFEAKEPWQQVMMDTAKAYLAEGWKQGAWLYMGGQPGCGKTHICTAVAGKLLYEKPTLYVVWPQVSKKLKALVMDAGDYEKELVRLQTIDVLYVDDLFKPVKDNQGAVLPPTAADMKVAFEIFNYRYINKLPTILSSEWHVAELADIDEATGSRIAERSKGYCVTIGRDRKRNWRYGGEIAV